MVTTITDLDLLIVASSLLDVIALSYDITVRWQAVELGALDVR
jgi:hypothetical protein